MDDKHRILHQVFGFEGFRPGQEAVVDAILAGRDSLTVMPTGRGKSLCFQVPALVKPGMAIVVSPLVALMQDQVAALQLAGVAAGTINSSRSRDDNVAVWRRAAAGELKLLYLSPERLTTQRMLAALGRLDISLVAVDEAHCISQWGPAFRPDYAALSALKQVFPNAPLAAFTASADPVTRDDIVARLFAGAADTFIHGFDRPNIRLAVSAKSNWKKQLLGFLDGREGQSGIVYCLSRKKTEQAAQLLNDSGLPALAYHAGMAAADRQINQDRFMSEPGLIMVATIAFGMGIDKPDVRFVFHTDLPGSPEAYYQEFGRAGRDGEPADAHMLFGLDDLRMRRQFIANDGGGEDRQRRENKRLDALVAYCDSPTCRRVALLRYFGEEAAPCGNCDVCLDPVELADGTAEACKVLAAVHQTGNRFGAAHLVDVLRGNSTEKVTQARHHLVAAFAAGADLPAAAWRGIIRQMVAADLLAIDIAGFGGLSITAAGRRLLAGGEAFRYRPAAFKSTRRLRRQRSEPAPPAGDVDRDLLARLKALRLKLARERNVPAYVIFPDRTLIDMAARQPRNPDEFAAVPGVGAVKLDAFADIFLAEIAAG